MKKTWSVFFLIFILQTNYLQSQDTPSIEVVGYAEISIVPNQIYYKVVLGDKRLGKEFYQLKNIDLQFWSVIKKHKIDESKVKVKDTSSRNIQYRRKKDEVLKTKTYEILFDDINLLDQFSEDLSKVEIISSKITSINHSQILTIEEELKIAAMKNAKSKATKLLNAVDANLGNILEVIEVAESTIQNFLQDRYETILGNRNNYDAGSYYNYGYDKSSSSLQFREVKVSASITVKFEIINEK